MKTLILCAILFIVGSFQLTAATQTAIVIHGGAGRISPSSLERFGEERYRATLRRALQAGHAVLKQDGNAMDAVEAAIVILENSPLFNAGKGAVFTSAGENEMDASIMDGESMKAGAVGGVTVIKNPIKGARAVMDQTPHVLLTGSGADAFGKSAGLEIVDRKYFHTDHRFESWEKSRKKKPGLKPSTKKGAALSSDRFYSTVGAVTRDAKGNIAAGTSTGGLTNKRFGRIGDSPIIGAGTYADNRVGGISCTGHGEFFIRHAVAFDILARTRYLKTDLQTSADVVVKSQLKDLGAGGGIIGLDSEGQVVTSFNTPSMFRGWIGTDGKLTVKIFK
jgi:L-asparaginase / beta-aspartyl-peptidase